MASVKKIVIAPFMELAGENAPPDFDRFRPCDIVILITFTDGTAAAYPLGNGSRFTMDF